jgi:hypothetical protein
MDVEFQILFVWLDLPIISPIFYIKFETLNFKLFLNLIPIKILNFLGKILIKILKWV